MPVKIEIKRPQNKPRANDLCWCGSGKKHKKCHRDRSKMAKVSLFAIQKKAMSEFDRKYCSHPDASVEECDQIIKSHTITKSLSLKSIAESGHVYSSKSGFADFNRNNSHFEPKKIGIKLASTFKGFCGKHDNKIFQPIESGRIELDCKSIFLLSYRTVAHEMYKKEAELFAIEVYKDELDKGLSLEQQYEFQSEMQIRVSATKTGLKETRISKVKYDRILIEQDFSKFKYVAVQLDTLLPVVSSGGRFPDFNFEKKPLFNVYDTYDEPPMAVLNIVNDNRGAIACIAWLRDDQRLIDFAENFLKMIGNRGSDFLIQLAITSSENTFYRPSWWENLDQKTRDFLCDASLSDVKQEVPFWYESIAIPMKFGSTGKVIETIKNY